MFGNVLIDKFQCYIPLPPVDKEVINGLKKHIEKALYEHYPPNAYKVWISAKYGRLSFWFTPTRYFKNPIEDVDMYDDTNVDMPAELELYQVFIDIMNHEVFFNTLQKCKITKLDITKNFAMKKKPFNYIEMLSKGVYNNGNKSILHTSGRRKNTLSISTLSRKAEKSDKVGDRELIVYDKSKELEKRHLKTIRLKKPILAEELGDAIDTKGIKYIISIDLSEINFLRLELQLGSSRKLADLSKFMKFDNADDGLYLKDFIDLMQNNKLYRSLDNFYTNYFFSVLVPKQDTDKDISSFNIYNKVLFNYFDEVKDLPLNAVMADNGLLNKYNALKRELQSYTQNELFEELKNKVITSNAYNRY